MVESTKIFSYVYVVQSTAIRKKILFSTSCCSLWQFLSLGVEGVAEVGLIGGCDVIADAREGSSNDRRGGHCRDCASGGT